MDHLWAPWRLSYVSQPAKQLPEGQQGDCFLCRGQSEADDRANRIALRTDWSTVVLNRFPYNNGHLLIAPKSHKAFLGELSREESIDLQQLIVRCMSAIDRIMTPDGYNVGLNVGRVAGAGLPGHLHWHVVPRWNGDTNFMPVLTDTRVISQSLDAFYELLTAHLS